MKNMIETKNLTKTYKEFIAVDHVSLHIKKGSIYGFLGPNGAGKSTTMKMLLGLTAPTDGEFQIDNMTFPNDRVRILKEVGSFIESPSFYPNLTGRENLDIIRRILELPASSVDKALELVGLSEFGNRLAKKYSLGMKQRLGLASALLGEPPVLILDEPTNGLDPAGIHEIRNLIKTLPKRYDCTVLISSHMLSEIELLADNIGILNHGRLLFEGSLIGNKDMKLDRNVLSGNLHIKEGRMITPEDKDMCVISEELAKQNNLKIGDKISFNDYHDTENSKVSEAEIVGIYQVDQKMSPLMQGDTYRSENVIFTDLRFPEKAEGETSPLYERAYFKVEDVEAYDEVKENLQKVDINWEQYDLIDNNGNSETMSSNFNDLAKVSEMMILVISVASFVILVLVFLFWLKNRVQEVGIFLSLGVPKFRIIGQIWSEAIMIAVLSLMLSFAVAPAVSKVTANYLVSQQVQQMQEEEKNNEGKVSTEYVAPKQDVQNISVEVTPEMYLLDGVSVLVLITASVLVSGIVILKRNPKDILSEMS